MTRQVSLRKHQRQPSRTLARSYLRRKGDAEIPSDVELMRLEVEACFKARIDGGRLRFLHSRIVAQVRHELVVEQQQQQHRACDAGQPSAAKVSNVAVGVADGDQERVVGIQTQDLLLSHICFHLAAEEDDPEAIFLPDHSVGATTSMSELSSRDTEDDINASRHICDPMGCTERDYLNISNFEELLSAFPCTPTT
ncbi:hypothetical protein BJ741DRAFT_634994 [Chytriomyces cf. hyalinus JEL632]|nr:hypothetical protein BJ741DRAFT_634994 [Chytriomyces cf. hyalinus JEL632]